ncbi:hypothetical protein CGZ94_04235 [Enemella evansiae]|uniref:DUF4253 domain-containing protein n=1 Tax=Enemella evansiae TaxID=2016499 RepID=A0A255GKQ2_9ACTN|nr:DUF4253 domain-containing protein [Enemella evansiae]OYN99513.1 hypothetical protein CGZ95_11425 [Enemella evansiae]OYO15911.1 hypothetical protein BI335_11575 [Enemella evansiae]OYO16399.1 hypothetical protein CGZ94_04235 [Enemella evansiae]
MGFRDAIRDAMGSKVRATPASQGGLDLDDLGFDQVNDNDWIRLQLRATEAGDPDQHNPGLPAGRLVRMNVTGRSEPIALCWLSDRSDQFSEEWYAVADRFPNAGIWPVLVEGASAVEPGWLAGGVGAPQAVADDAEALLARTYSAAEELEGLEPWRSRWLGLAAGEPAKDQLVGVRPVAGERSLLLTPVTRPADVPAALGWTGAEGYEYTGGDVSAVLRSWEDRFGAVLVGLGPDRLRLSVERPPRYPEQARQLAGEHYGLAPDVIDQDPEAYAELLFSRREWDFWWN